METQTDDQFKIMKIIASIVAIIGMFLPWFSTNICLMTLRTHEWFRYGPISLVFGRSSFFESKRVELWHQLVLLFRRFPLYLVLFILMYVLFLGAAILLIVNLIQVFQNKSQTQTNIILTTISFIMLVISGLGSFLGGFVLHAEIRAMSALTELSYRLSFGYYITLIGGAGIFILTRLTNKQTE